MRPRNRPRKRPHPLHRTNVERRAQRAEDALKRERERRNAEARRSLLSAMVTDLASGFVNAPSDSVDRAILQALQELCHAVGGDRALLSTWDASTGNLHWRQSWSRRGVPDASARGSTTDLSAMPRWRTCAAEAGILDVHGTASLPGSDGVRAFMTSLGIGSILALPLMEEERCTGFLVIETHGREQLWTHDEFSALVVAAELFSNSAMRRQREAMLERALDEARSALRAKDAFLANLTHELRTPLNGVLGMAQLLGQQKLAPAQLEQISTIHGSAGHLMQLLDSLLDFARLDAGGVEPQRETVDLSALASDAAAAVAPHIRPGHVALSATLAAGTPRHVTSDRGRLLQLLGILLGNAAQHTSQGTIRLEVSSAGGRLRLEVADSGSGIPEAVLRHTFDPFVQADSSNTRRHGGLGLGLAIAKRIAVMLGGGIAVTSTTGRGTVFTVDLPLILAEAPADPPPVAAPASTAPPSTKPGTDMRVLVIEDNKVNRLIAQGMLQQLGCVVDSAEDGIEGAHKVLSGAYNMVFMDIQMPRMDGIAATRAIRGGEARAGRPRTPIVALTCLGQPEDRARGLAAGMDGYLTKPIAQRSLAEAIASYASSPVPTRARTILVVDDNAVNLRLISLIAAQSGNPVETAVDGRAAVERVAAGGIALVLMDCQMPVLDGYEATRAIRAAEARGAPRTAIVAVTAHALPENRERCRACGMDGFIAKPIMADAVLETIRHHLSGPAPSPAPIQARQQPAAGATDLATLRQLDEVAPGSGQGIARTMLHDLALALEAMPSLLRGGDLAQLAKDAHKLKGAVGSIGGTDLARTCAKLEQAAKSGDATASAALLEAFQNGAPAFAAALRSYAEQR